MPFTTSLLRSGALLLALALTSFYSLAAEPMSWGKLAPIPDAQGFAGAFAGTSGGGLLVAGGAHLVGDIWADPIQKQWYDHVYVLSDPAGAWREVGRLPGPLAYGVSISVDDALICVGGSTPERHSAEVFRLELVGGLLVTWENFPALPHPLANSCGALVGRTIYVAGGIEHPADTKALHNFWALDLDATPLAWRELEPWPGPERMLAVAAAQDGSFLLFSGTSLAAGADGKPVRTYLRDAYRFTPGHGWSQLADLPRAAVAAPSPAIPQGADALLILTGDDGLHVNFTPPQDHPGFPRNVLRYDAKADRWSEEGVVPFSRATVPVAFWRERFVIPNGEVRPRERTNEVWTLQLP